MFPQNKRAHIQLLLPPLGWIQAIVFSTALAHGSKKVKKTGVIIQRYSIQRWVAFKKYHRQLFVAFLDMAIGGGFILHKVIVKRKSERVFHTRRRQLHVELPAVTAVSFPTNQDTDDLMSVPMCNRNHVLCSTTELYKAKSDKSKG
ncbi:LOW QUALITY PROTEIN: Hypothetical protein PHPALM_13814 [Phytophthora palmivora]|uniref:Uncharacterized protein n=1 Tax=Phytophthora palmivora TaxID=4796 RepID=A0A2P4XWF4_9STRA|nr:LOW QUALITY PROTEIN: Hypothetical protein PHPALM_13814 [Phytophthora palmivora]